MLNRAENLDMDANHGLSSALRSGGVASPIDPADTLFLIVNHYFAQAAIIVISTVVSMLACRIFRHWTGNVNIRFPDSRQSPVTTGSLRPEYRLDEYASFASYATIRLSIQKFSIFVSGSLLFTSLSVTLDFCEYLYVIVERFTSVGTHAVTDLAASNI
jgi:hypothetical protein